MTCLIGWRCEQQTMKQRVNADNVDIFKQSHFRNKWYVVLIQENKAMSAMQKYTIPGISTQHCIKGYKNIILTATIYPVLKYATK